MANEEVVKSWVLTEFLPKEFDKNGQILKHAEITPSPAIGTDHFTSHSFFTDVEYEDQDQKLAKTSLMIKCASQHERFRKFIKADEQFYNEITFYKEVVPIFEKYLKEESPDMSIYDLCPRMWFSHYDENHLEKSTLALGNLQLEGFRTTESKTDLDLDHCKLAFTQIAKFHSISYAMKISDRETFDRLSNLFKEVRIFKEKENDIDGFYKVTSCYGVDYLLEHKTSSIPEDFLLRLKKKFDKCYDICKFCVTPTEPLSVICHGDFLRNNLLYKYENEKPVDIRLIDFQLARHASPFHDISVFLFMNTTYELRRKHLKELLKLYYITVVEEVALLLTKDIKEVRNIYKFELFEEEMKRYSLLGFMVSAFFLPIMMVENPFGKSTQDFEEIFISYDVPAADRGQNIIMSINDESRDRIIGMIQELYESGIYID